jgi:hypothetical protein
MMPASESLVAFTTIMYRMSISCSRTSSRYRGRFVM